MTIATVRTATMSCMAPGFGHMVETCTLSQIGDKVHVSIKAGEWLESRAHP